MDRTITVYGVRNWRCDDRARIGTYSVNRVEYDPQSSQLSLIFCENCEVFLEVKPDFEIILEPWCGDVGNLQ